MPRTVAPALSSGSSTDGSHSITTVSPMMCTATSQRGPRVVRSIPKARATVSPMTALCRWLLIVWIASPLKTASSGLPSRLAGACPSQVAVFCDVRRIVQSMRLTAIRNPNGCTAPVRWIGSRSQLLRSTVMLGLSGITYLTLALNRGSGAEPGKRGAGAGDGLFGHALHRGGRFQALQECRP